MPLISVLAHEPEHVDVQSTAKAGATEMFKPCTEAPVISVCASEVLTHTMQRKHDLDADLLFAFYFL